MNLQATKKHKAVKVVIRKDLSFPSTPWFADLIFDDGTQWTGWQSYYRSKTKIIKHCEEIIRGHELMFKRKLTLEIMACKTSHLIYG